MSWIRSVCVYCGSAAGHDPAYAETATQFGDALARSGKTLVYGGGRIGLMGLCADACLNAGGRVVGVIPRFLEEWEVGHGAVSELIVVDSMHERKQRMADLADAFVVLPGGYGTLDEFFEILTWRQLRLHAKPILVADVKGCWAPLETLLRQVQDNGFARRDDPPLARFVADPAAALAELDATPPSALGDDSLSLA